MNTYQNFLNLAEWAKRSGDMWLHARAIARLKDMDKSVPRSTAGGGNYNRETYRERLLSVGHYPDWPENVFDYEFEKQKQWQAMQRKHEEPLRRAWDANFRQVGNYEDKIKERGYFTFDEISEFTPEQFEVVRQRILGNQTPPTK